MVHRKIRLSLVVGIACQVISVSAQQNVADSVYFEPVKRYLTTGNKPAGLKIEKDAITIIASGHTDLFSSADGYVKVNSAPRLMFRPDKNFILKAQVSCNLLNNWDGAVLLIEKDTDHWAKLCFERDYKGNVRIVTVVTDGVSDDCNSDVVRGNSVCLQIAYSNNVVYFYYSTNNSDLYLVRNFKFPYSNGLKVGFLAQASTDKENSATFSNIQYSGKALKNFWKGE
jgi:uncharacterized protein